MAEKLMIAFGKPKQDEEIGSEGEGMSKEEHSSHMESMMSGIKAAKEALNNNDVEAAKMKLDELLGEEQSEAKAEGEAPKQESSFDEDIMKAMGKGK